MQFLKNKFGLKTFVLCWMLVLLVPHWRESARHHWQSDNLDVYLVRDVIGLTDEKITEIARSSPNDWRAKLESIKGYFGSVSEQTIENPDPKKAVALNKARLEAIRRMARDNDEYIDQYMVLSRQYPQENAIRKVWILKAVSSGLKIESAPANSGGYPKHKPVSNSRIELLIRCTVDGAKLEPKNSYFPLMQAAFLFSLKRETEAVAAIRRAATCEYFDDGTRETMVRRIDLLSRVQNVTWFEKNVELWLTLFPHFAPIHQTESETLRVAAKKQRAGKEVEALRLSYDLQRINQTLGSSNQFLTSALIGRSWTVDVWRKTLENSNIQVGTTRKNDFGFYSAKERSEVAQAFSKYARKLKQNEIANSALKVDESFEKYGEYKKLRFPDDVRGRDSIYLSTSYWLQCQVLKMALIGAICWGLSAICTSKMEMETLSTRRTLFSWTAFCIGATIVYLAVGIYFYEAGSGSFGNYYRDYSEESLNFRRAFEQTVPGVLSWIWLAPVALLTGVQYILSFISGRKIIGKLHWGNGLIGLLYTVNFLLFFVLVFASNGTENRSRYLLSQWPMCLFWFLFALLVTATFHIWTSTGKNRVAALSFWGAVGTAILSINSISIGNDVLTWNYAAASFFLLVLSILIRGWSLLSDTANRNRKFSFQLPDDFSTLAFRVRVFAAVLSVFASVTYLGCNLASIAPEARMNATLDRQLQIGEVAWLDEQRQRSGQN